MIRRRLVHNSLTRATVKTYLQIVIGQTPDDAMVDRFVTSFYLLERLLNDITTDVGSGADTNVVTRQPASSDAKSICQCAS